MITPLTCASYASNAGLLGAAPIAVHHFEGADVGNAFYWEQRHWLAHLGVADPVKFRKREKERAVLEKLVDEWSCYDTALCRPSDDAVGFRTVVLSTYLLGAWLSKKPLSTSKGNNRDLALRWVACLTMYVDVALRGAAMCEDATIISCLGVDFSVNRACNVPVAAVQRLAGGAFAAEWGDVRGSGLPRALAPLSIGGVVSLADLVWFLTVRVYYSSTPLSRDHWLVRFRNASLRTTSVFVELYVGHVLERCASAKLREADLQARCGRRRQRMSTLKKSELIAIKLEKYGATETLLNGSERVTGLAARMRTASNALYVCASQALLKTATCLAVNWDGSCHGGLAVNAGIVYDPIAALACYMAPQVGGRRFSNVCF